MCSSFSLQNENFSTLKGEFLPYLIKKQMAKSSGHSTTNPVSDTQSELGLGTKQGDNIFDVSIRIFRIFLNVILFFKYYCNFVNLYRISVYSPIKFGTTNF